MMLYGLEGIPFRAGKHCNQLLRKARLIHSLVIVLRCYGMHAVHGGHVQGENHHSRVVVLRCYDMRACMQCMGAVLMSTR